MINTAQDFGKLFEGQTICLVGNSKNLMNQHYAEEIDSHDVVCRINDSLKNTTHPIYSKYYGKKTDVLFINLLNCIRTPLIAKYKPSVVIQTTPTERINSKIINGMYTESDLEELKTKMNATVKPSTGIRCLDYLMKSNGFPIINVYGFDWKKTPSFIAGKDDKSTIHHNFNEERDYCMTNFFNNNSPFVLKA